MNKSSFSELLVGRKSKHMFRTGLSRRRFLPTAAAALGAGSFAGLGRARAASFPSQPINFIIPYGPGGSFDAYVREFSVLLEQNLPQHVNVEPINVPGAAGKEAIFQLMQDPPDGYNISLINVPGILMSKKGGNLDLDKLTWIANIGRDSYGLAVAKNGPVQSVADLQALAAKRPLKFSSTGVGSTDYFATKVFTSALGMKVSLVSGYNDSPNSVVAVARGDVDAVVHSLATLQQLEASGLAKIIFVFQEKSPIPGVADATTLGQPDLGKIYQWRPVVGAPGIPPDIAATLSSALVASTKSAAAAKWASGLGTTLYPLDQAGTLDMVKVQKALIAKWQSVLA
jgi:tripartite-type tricarboxylate transporter receptor subunit TctC